MANEGELEAQIKITVDDSGAAAGAKRAKKKVEAALRSDPVIVETKIEPPKGGSSKRVKVQGDIVIDPAQTEREAKKAAAALKRELKAAISATELKLADPGTSRREATSLAGQLTQLREALAGMTETIKAEARKPKTSSTTTGGGSQSSQSGADPELVKQVRRLADAATRPKSTTTERPSTRMPVTQTSGDVSQDERDARRAVSPRSRASRALGTVPAERTYRTTPGRPAASLPAGPVDRSAARPGATYEGYIDDDGNLHVVRPGRPAGRRLRRNENAARARRAQGGNTLTDEFGMEYGPGETATGASQRALLDTGQGEITRNPGGGGYTVKTRGKSRRTSAPGSEDQVVTSPHDGGLRALPSRTRSKQRGTERIPTADTVSPIGKGSDKYIPQDEAGAFIPRPHGAGLDDILRMYERGEYEDYFDVLNQAGKPTGKTVNLLDVPGLAAHLKATGLESAPEAPYGEFRYARVGPRQMANRDIQRAAEAVAKELGVPVEDLLSGQASESVRPPRVRLRKGETRAQMEARAQAAREQRVAAAGSFQTQAENLRSYLAHNRSGQGVTRGQTGELNVSRDILPSTGEPNQAMYWLRPQSRAARRGRDFEYLSQFLEGRDSPTTRGTYGPYTTQEVRDITEFTARTGGARRFKGWSFQRLTGPELQEEEKKRRLGPLYVPPGQARRNQAARSGIRDQAIEDPTVARMGKAMGGRRWISTTDAPTDIEIWKQQAGAFWPQVQPIYEAFMSGEQMEDPHNRSSTGGPLYLDRRQTLNQRMTPLLENLLKSVGYKETWDAERGKMIPGKGISRYSQLRNIGGAKQVPIGLRTLLQGLNDDSWWEMDKERQAAADLDVRQTRQPRARKTGKRGKPKPSDFADVNYPTGDEYMAAAQGTRAETDAGLGAGAAPPPGGGRRGGPGMAGGGNWNVSIKEPLRVHVVNFSELKGMVAQGIPSRTEEPYLRAAGERAPRLKKGADIYGPKRAEALGRGFVMLGEKSISKLSESKEEQLEREKVGDFDYSFRARQRLDKALGSLRKRYKLDEYATSPFSFNPRQQALQEAQEKIVAAQALNPARAFQSAVAAAAARTFGGGAAFQGRLNQYRGVIGARASVVGLQAENEENLLRNQFERAGLLENIRAQRKAGGTVDPKLLEAYRIARQERAGLKGFAGRLETSLTGTGETVAEADRGSYNEREIRSIGLNAAEERAKKGLISPGGVVRGFAALGLGAIGGGLIFSAASQAVQAGMEMLATQAERGADALSGFYMTATKVNAQLAQAINAANGDVRGAIAGVAASSGISTGTLDKLGLGNRASILAAITNQTQANDLFRAASNTGVNPLFTGTGGPLPFAPQLFAPQSGLFESIADQINQFQGPTHGFFDLDPNARSTTQNTANYVKDLNDQLQKAGSSFEVLTDATDAQRDAFRKTADAVGQGDIGRKFATNGVVIWNPQTKQVVSPDEFQQAGGAIAAGRNILDPGAAFRGDERALKAQMRAFDREQQQELSFTIPTQSALSNLANPLPTPGASLATGKLDTKETVAQVKSDTSDIVKLQDQLNAEYAKGNQLLKEALPPDLYKSIKETGEAMASIQTGISQRNAALAAREYSNQLRIAQRSLNDINALIGRGTKGQYDGLGYIEKQNVALQRQSQELQFQLQQRQINFQLAIAGFTTPGDTPEERAARRRDAETQASFAQKQLDIQKKLFGNEIKVFDIQNLRAAQDAMESIGLLKQGRATALANAADEERLARLSKIQDENVKKAGTYLAKIEKQIGLANSEIQKLEATYGEATYNIATDIVNGFIRTIKALRHGLDAYLGSGMTGTENNPGKAQDDIGKASGALFNTTGATPLIVGEAGQETVAILRNPRQVSATGMGGGGPSTVQININSPVVRDDADIRRIAEAVERVLNRKTALMGLRN